MSIYIKSAWYGAADEKAMDVTAAVTSLFGSPQKTTIFTISPQIFGLSGLPAKTRYFSMTYSYSSAPDATLITKSGADGASWKIYASDPNAAITITQATYGTSEIFVDLTEKMQLALKESDQNGAFTVGSASFLTRYCDVDIAPGIQKVLCVTYQAALGEPFQTWCAPDFTAVNLTFGPTGSN
ncbi:MAG: hypothetical protein HYZ14_07685 [Bacteroidetes bacterium]|nr:hypothetical protein [Bacteroidota bacterium]